MCGMFCSCAVRSAHVRSVLPAESFDPDPFFRWKVLLRYILFVTACYIYGQSVRSSLQSVHLCSPFRRVCQQKVLIKAKTALWRTWDGIWVLKSRYPIRKENLFFRMSSQTARLWQQQETISEKKFLRRRIFEKMGTLCWRKAREHGAHELPDRTIGTAENPQSAAGIRHQILSKNLHTLDSSVI